MSGVNEIRSSFLDYFARQRPRGRAVVAARAAQRPDPDVHQCRHGAVQERLHRPREAPLRARDHRAEMRARRRQAQRPRQCRLHRAPPHLLRDARQLLVRRLLQGPRHRARLEPGHQGVRAADRSPDWSPSIVDDDQAFDLWKKIAGLPESKIIRIAGSDNFWQMGDTGPCGPCSEIFYDHGPHIPGGPPGSPDAEGDRFIEIWNLVFMQYEQLARRQARRPAAALDRHRHGARAHRRGAAGHARQLQDRSVRRDHLARRRSDRRRARRPARRVASRHRRSSARVGVPDRRRRAALERRAAAMCSAASCAAPCATPSSSARKSR